MKQPTNLSKRVWLLLTTVLLGWAVGSHAEPPKAPAAQPPPLVAPAKPLGQITALAYSPDGKRLALGVFGEVVLYDTVTWQPVATFTKVEDAVRVLTFHPDGKTLAIGSGLPAQSGDLCFWDTSGANPTLNFVPHKDTIEAIAFRSDGKAMLAACNDSTAHYLQHLPDVAGPFLTEHNGRVLAVAFSPNKDYVFVTGSLDKIVKVWDPTTLHTVVNFDQSEAGITGLAFINDTQFIGSSLDGRLFWWSVNYDKRHRTYSGDNFRVLSAHEGGVLTMSLSADRARLITGGMDDAVIVWKADDGGQIRVFKESAGPIYAVALSPDGKLAAAGGADGLLRVWDVEGNKLLQTLTPPHLPEPKPKPEIMKVRPANVKVVKAKRIKQKTTAARG